MERYLKPGQRFSLDGIDGTFEVREIIGRGASCVAYFTHFIDRNNIRTEHLLKEYNPKHLELCRNEDGELLPTSESEKAAFMDGLRRFEEGYKTQLWLRQEYPELKNATSNIEGVYSGNGTKYISMPCFMGKPYSDALDSTFYLLLQHAKALTDVVGKYHANGFLHLDIKPGNIFVLPETAELVMLFDFDSVVKKADLSSAAGLSYTKTWAAPEQILPGYRHKIREATDLYAIGEIIFYQLMGRHPVKEERRSFAQYRYDLDSDMLKDVNPQALPLLSELFRHTICTDVSKRYQSAKELVEKLEELLPLADPKAPRLISSPPLAHPLFVGRSAEIQRIHQQLQEHQKLFLSGIGGIGKSELAKQYTQCHAEEYDVILFARYVNNFETLFASDQDIRIANVSMYAGEAPLKYSKRKRRFFRDLCDKRTLLIIDNLDRTDDPLLSEILRLNCHVLITTRLDFSEYNQPQMTVGILDAQQDIEAVFQNNYQRDLSEETWSIVRRLIQLVDCHTMAVELLAKQMRASELEPAEMFERLKDYGFSASGREKIRTGKDGDFSGRNAFGHIRALFNVAELETEQQKLLMNMSLLPYTGIAKKRMKDWCKWDGYDALNELIASGWVKEGSSGIIALHPLVAEVAMEQLKEVPKSCQVFLKSARDYARGERKELTALQRQEDAALLNAVAMNVVRSGMKTKGIASFLDIVPFAIGGFGYLDNCIRCRQRALELFEKQDGDTRATVARELNSLAVLYENKGDLNTAERQHKKALEIRRELYGNDPHKDLGESYGSLGGLYLKKGNLSEAELFLKESLQIYRDVYNTPHKNIASVLNNMGVLYSELGDFKLAEQYYCQALDMRKELFNGIHESLAFSWNNLGNLYRKNGDLQSAEKSFHSALDVFHALYGEKHELTASVLNNLGVLYGQNGNLEKAAIYYQQAYQTRKELFGEEHPSTLHSYQSLGGFSYCKKDYVESRTYYHKALNGYRKLYGNYSPRVADILSSLGAVSKKLGNLSEAEEYLYTSKEIYEQLYGDDHLDVARILNVLGNLFKEKGELNVAESYLQNAYTIQKRLLGAEHPIIVQSILDIGTLFYEKGDSVAAEKKFQDALNIRLRKFGEHHPGTADIWKRLGEFYLAEGDVDKASFYIDRAYNVYLELFGEHHSTIAATLRVKGDLNVQQGNYLAAEKNYLQAKKIFEKLSEGPNRNIASTLNKLAILYKKHGDYSVAEAAYLEALSIYRVIYGNLYPAVAMVLNNLGDLCYVKKEYVQAKAYFEQSLEIRRYLFGDDNKNTAASWGRVGLACGKLGEFSYAEKCCRKEIETICSLMGEEHLRSANAFYHMGCVYADQGKVQQAREYLSKALVIRQAKLGEANPDTMEVKAELEKLT